MANSDHSALEIIRKESLDIYNRLHSIEEDISFVDEVHKFYSDIPIIPNLRCGAWYTNPAISADIPAYFKSTDGHYGNWGFNLRRANLHLLPFVAQNRGLVLVDSTRSGKRIPDALSKTVPIWCAVVNRAVLRRYRDAEVGGAGEWDGALYTPPGVVSSQEHSQIALRVDGWAEALAASSFELPRLPVPLRPIWITPSTSQFPPISEGNEGSRFLPVICVSASKQVQEGVERRLGGFSYVQGSGDDHELWGMGLTPQIFWDHRRDILSVGRPDLLHRVQQLVDESSQGTARSAGRQDGTPVAKVRNRISIDTVANVQSQLHGSMGKSPRLGYVLISDEDAGEEPAMDPNPSFPSTLTLRGPTGKKSQIYFLHEVLPKGLAFIKKELDAGHDICVACPTGKDLSVGLALAAISAYFDEEGTYTGHTTCPIVNKQAIKTRLEWIIASRPEANPSRTTLKRVNEYLLTDEHLRR
ncbi:initiator tRNA phosphoribosyl transferase [Coprinopsis marcescibilis]|uniref:Initiator tRNA phosphoribosyl transferase n=1 Tax=Coprinopsis marcescibilis TaxID=230819 RepID=A0A5C3L778_COPMA|nr:initiator tRNA phosphoribosyl transferase [Coprinopsis marcescibilis]